MKWLTLDLGTQINWATGCSSSLRFRNRELVSKASLLLQSIQVNVSGRKQDPPGSYLMSTCTARTPASVKAKPHQQLFSEVMFLGAVGFIHQYRTGLHTGNVTLCWSGFDFPVQLFWINVVSGVLLEKTASQIQSTSAKSFGMCATGML